MCTVAVPFAQVDLAALAELDDPSLNVPALESPRTIIDTILRTTVSPRRRLARFGSPHEKAGLLAAANGRVTALLADTAVEDGRAGMSGLPPRNAVRCPESTD